MAQNFSLNSSLATYHMAEARAMSSLPGLATFFFSKFLHLIHQYIDLSPSWAHRLMHQIYIYIKTKTHQPIKTKTHQPDFSFPNFMRVFCYTLVKTTCFYGRVTVTVHFKQYVLTFNTYKKMKLSWFFLNF